MCVSAWCVCVFQHGVCVFQHGVCACFSMVCVRVSAWCVCVSGDWCVADGALFEYQGPVSQSASGEACVHWQDPATNVSLVFHRKEDFPGGRSLFVYVVLKTECGCPSAGGIKNGHIRYPPPPLPSYGLTQKERKKICCTEDRMWLPKWPGELKTVTWRKGTQKERKKKYVVRL